MLNVANSVDSSGHRILQLHQQGEGVRMELTYQAFGEGRKETGKRDYYFFTPKPFQPQAGLHL